MKLSKAEFNKTALEMLDYGISSGTSAPMLDGDVGAWFKLVGPNYSNGPFPDEANAWSHGPDIFTDLSLQEKLLDSVFGSHEVEKAALVFTVIGHQWEPSNDNPKLGLYHKYEAMHRFRAVAVLNAVRAAKGLEPVEVVD